MSQPPPYNPPPLAQTYTLPPSAPTNALALTSFILSLILCIPGLTSLAAIITGILGLKKSHDTGNGRGLATAGLIIGIVGLLGWAIAGAAVYTGIRFVRNATLNPTRAVATTFVNALATGDTQTASTLAEPSFPPTQLNALTLQLRPLGSVSNFSINSFNITGSPGSFHVTLGGTAHFQNASHPFTATFQQHGPGPTFKIEDLQIR